MKRIFLVLAVFTALALGGLGLSQAQAGGPPRYNNYYHRGHGHVHSYYRAPYHYHPYRAPVYQSYRPYYQPYYVHPRGGVQIYGPRGGFQLRF
ncbi:hypothetical protein Psta_4038 [Pirellula staleyi DSM 6068]|uniref:Uncharacterized protein n=1 Tax=Pirellula staleyi (strain ATCC 27377 / DSM 6068 / ICPB 4128) TaxID=530564 RepID=D2R2V8_PIRSD|nr:hypothetical protein [Pirellula staleyi]ADB18691.1 hypothetical protein Psta_4038 [Pirellula staleyi DSM 6068]